ncbi:MAG: LamG domain-containing protein [Kofleriaceae bacterium]
MVDANESCASIPGVRARWLAENNADNAVGGFTGTAVGNVTYGPGKYGNAFQFNGTTSAIKVDDMEMLWPTGSFSIEAWIKAAPSFTGTGIALIKYACADVCIAPNDKAYYALYMVSGAPAVDIRSNSEANILKLINTSKVVNDNIWHHLVGVRDNTNLMLHLYVDGTLSTSMALTQSQIGAMSDLDANLDYVIMGAAPTTGTSTVLDTFFPGAVDNPAYYDRALTAAEVLDLYEKPEGACP